MKNQLAAVAIPQASPSEDSVEQSAVGGGAADEERGGLSLSPAMGAALTVARALERLPHGEVRLDIPGQGIQTTTRRLDGCDEGALDAAITQKGEVLVVVTSAGPVIAGVIQSIAPEATARDRTISARRLRLEADEEVKIDCGPSSLTLRGNGRVLVRGDYVDSTSRGTLRIRGGAVKIN